MELNLTKMSAKAGAGNANAKLDERQVKLIRTYYKGGFKQKELAELFGVKQGTISAIITRKSWKEVQ
jgi:RNA polymerase sigma factor (sigma-70 family)